MILKNFILAVIFGLIWLSFQYKNSNIDTKKFEGLKLCVYTDTTGHKTIGYGHNLSKQKLSSNCITKSQAETLYKEDMTKAQIQVKQLVKTYENQPKLVQDVLNDLSFNLGINSLKKFKNFIAAIDAQDYRKASLELNKTKWHKQVKVRANKIEEALMTISR